MHENVYQQLWNIIMGKQMMKIYLKVPFSVPETEVCAEKGKQRSVLL